MEDDKESMVQKIKQWLAIETKINQLSREIRELRAMKKSINPELLTIMKENEIDCFDCNSGKITYTKNNVKKTINKKYLHDILQKYYGNEQSAEASNVCNFILDNREVQVKENIKFKKNK